jgi:hypothetical protein
MDEILLSASIFVCFLLTQIPKKVYHLSEFADATSVKQRLFSVARHGGRGGQGKGCYAARVENLIMVRPVNYYRGSSF